MGMYANARVFLMAHERLILAAIAGVVLWFSLGKVDTMLVNHDKAQLTQAQAVAQIQQSKDAVLAQQAAQQAADYKVLAAQVAQQNAQLEQANVTLATALAKQQKTDATLPPSELVNRWLALVPEAKPKVTPTGVALDNAGAVATVQQLEIIPVQQQEITNVQGELKHANTLVAAEGEQIATLNTLVAGKEAELGDNAKVCSAQLATVKAEARKSKLHWFEAGVAVGFIGRQLLKVGL